MVENQGMYTAFPILISLFLNLLKWNLSWSESSSFVKIIFREMNKRLTREACIKIIEQAERTEAEFADCFTAAVTGDSMHDIYKVR